MGGQPVKAVLFDVDGTLYHQAPLRALMALELALLPLGRRSLDSARRTWRALHSFRQVREELRSGGAAELPLVRAQYVRAAQRARMEPSQMEATVSEWIFERPLKYLRACRRAGIERFFAQLESRSIQVGVFSDYPVTAKLEALGLAGRTSLELCATDPEIDAFKPDPKGWLRACALWGLQPTEVLYVGDRPEVDAEGAARAGLPCAILSRKLRLRGTGAPSASFTTFSSFTGLQHALDVGG